MTIDDDWESWPYEQQVQLLTELRREAPLPLLDWTRDYVPSYFSLPASRLHKRLAHRLDTLQPGARFNLIAPRDAAKSTWLSLAFPLRRAVEELDPYILLISDTQLQARKYLKSIKRQIDGNVRLRQDYPGLSAGETWNADSIELSNGVEIEAVGTGGAIRGRKSEEDRPTLVIVDDPESRDHITSAPRREDNWRWLTQDLLNVGSPETKYVIAGTALHRQGMVNRLATEPGWETWTTKSIEQWPSHMDLWEEWERVYTTIGSQSVERAEAFYREHQAEMDAGAVVQWPEREPIYRLMKLRVDLGRTAFESEKQGNPINPELCEWPEDYFDDSIWFEHWPTNIVCKVLTLDPSKGRADKLRDYSAFVWIGIAAGGTVYVDADLQRRPIPQMLADGVEHYKRFQPHAFGIESDLWQELLAPDFMEEFRRQGVFGPPVTTMETKHVPKPVRIRRISPYLSGRQIRFRRTAGCRLLVDQMRDFPIGDHDDGPDALEMAIRLAGELMGSENAEEYDEYLA